jgi:hypothetical protein
MRLVAYASEMTPTRRSRRVAFAVSLPLVAVGSLAAHSLAYRAAVPNEGRRLGLLERSGHGYLAYGHLAVALSVTVLVVALAVVVFAARKGRTCRAPPVWLVALVAAFAFAVQEHVERLLVSGELPLDAVREPTFAVGLVLQLTFAAVAALLARALLAFGEVIGRALARRRRQHPARGLIPSMREASVSLAPVSILALGHAQRAPPLPLSFG